MKETNFVPIEVGTGIFKKRLPEMIVSKDTPITGQDISNYADLLAKALKKAPPEQARIFLIQALSAETLINRYFYSKLPLFERWAGAMSEDMKEDLENQIAVLKQRTYPEEVAVMRLEIARIQAAIQEELKKRLVNDPDLAHLQYSNLFFEVSAPFDEHPLVTQQKTLNQDPYIFKTEKCFATPFEIGEHTRALKLLSELPDCDYILKPAFFDSKRLETLTEEVELRHGGVSFFRQTDPATSLHEDLCVLRDCLKGAQFLADNGLGLQDITPQNIGSYIKAGRRIGILFDLEGIYPLGVLLKKRMRPRSRPIPEIDENVQTPFQTSEMVYQFGHCIREITYHWLLNDSSPSVVKEELEKLCENMTIFRTVGNPIEGRVSLATALETLEGLISQLRPST